MDNTEGENVVKVASRVDCVFEISGELLFMKRCFHGVCLVKHSCMHISTRRNFGMGYKYIRCCLVVSTCKLILFTSYLQNMHNIKVYLKAPVCLCVSSPKY
jgi:hypothetical protein